MELLPINGICYNVIMDITSTSNRYAVVDLEATGTGIDAKIIQIGIVIVENREIVETYSTDINPYELLDDHIKNLTGITDQQLAIAPDFGQVAGQIYELISDAIFVAHNVKFDANLLAEALFFEGYDLLSPRVDTVELSQLFFPTFDKYSLGNLAEYLDLGLEQAHTAISDALATARLLIKIQEKIKSLPTFMVENLLLLADQLLFESRLVIDEMVPYLSDNLSESFLKFDSVLEIESYLRRIAENICHMQPQRQSDELTNTGMDIVEKMSEYAVNNYNMDITIRNLAENVFFMNQSYISHLFAEKKGISFSAFLRMIRICHAKEFLADARWSVTDVALMSGYNDTSQFIRIFRQETGMTPKKYRIFLKNGGSENESRES